MPPQYLTESPVHLHALQRRLVSLRPMNVERIRCILSLFIRSVSPRQTGHTSPQRSPYPPRSRESFERQRRRGRSRVAIRRPRTEWVKPSTRIRPAWTESQTTTGPKSGRPPASITPGPQLPARPRGMAWYAALAVRAYGRAGLREAKVVGQALAPVRL